MEILELRQFLDCFAALTLSQSQLVQVLKIQPELCARAEEMSQAEGRVTGDRPLSVENSGHPIRWNIADAPVPRRSCPTREVPQSSARPDEWACAA